MTNGLTIACRENIIELVFKSVKYWVQILLYFAC